MHRIALLRLVHAKQMVRLWRRHGGEDRLVPSTYRRAAKSCRLGIFKSAVDCDELGGENTEALVIMADCVAQIEIEFKIHGTASLYGDGLGIWLTKQRAQTGPVFGFMDKFEGLGIFVDTYKNNRPGVVFPYVSAMMGDGNIMYDKDHDGKANELAGCPVCILNKSACMS
jgi:Legume-like lectin family